MEYYFWIAVVLLCVVCVFCLRLYNDKMQSVKVNKGNVVFFYGGREEYLQAKSKLRAVGFSTIVRMEPRSASLTNKIVLDAASLR